MMRRFAQRLLCLLCIGCLLSACANQNSNNEPAAERTDAGNTAVSVTEASSQAGKSAQSAKTEASDDKPDEEIATVNRPAEDLAFVRFSNITGVKSETAEKNERAVVRMAFDVVSVSKKASDGETELSSLSRKLSEQEYRREQAREAGFSAYVKTAEKKDRQEKFDCDMKQQLSVLRADTRVFSYLEEQTRTIDTAGASPEEEEDFYSCISYNLDALTAKEILLSDVVNDVEALSVLAADAVLEKYDTTNPAYHAAVQFEGTDLQKRILELFNNADDESAGLFAWAPAYHGLRLVFAREALCEEESLASYLEEVSEINPRDFKRYDVTIPYTAAPLLFEADYTELPVSYIARLESGAAYYVDFGNGPELLQIATPRKYENNTVLYTGECTIRTGENDRQSFDLVATEEYGNLGVCVYLVKQEDRFFLYLDATGKGAPDRLHVYAFEDGNVRFVGISDEMLDNDHLPPFDPACFMTEGVFYILPDPFMPDAYTGNRGFHESFVSGSGMPASDTRFYEVAEEDIRVTAADLTLDTLQDADDNRPVKEDYPAGTSLSMWRIERGSHADFKTDDGRMVRLYINGVDTIDLIDGHELHEAFADPRKEPE